MPVVPFVKVLKPLYEGELPNPLMINRSDKWVPSLFRLDFFRFSVSILRMRSSHFGAAFRFLFVFHQSIFISASINN